MLANVIADGAQQLALGKMPIRAPFHSLHPCWIIAAGVARPLRGAGRVGGPPGTAPASGAERGAPPPEAGALQSGAGAVWRRRGGGPLSACRPCPASAPYAAEPAARGSGPRGPVEDGGKGDLASCAVDTAAGCAEAGPGGDCKDGAVVAAGRAGDPLPPGLLVSLPIFLLASLPPCLRRRARAHYVARVRMQACAAAAEAEGVWGGGGFGRARDGGRDRRFGRMAYRCAVRRRPPPPRRPPSRPA